MKARCPALFHGRLVFNLIRAIENTPITKIICNGLPGWQLTQEPSARYARINRSIASNAEGYGLPSRMTPAGEVC